MPSSFPKISNPYDFTSIDWVNNYNKAFNIKSLNKKCLNKTDLTNLIYNLLTSNNTNFYGDITNFSGNFGNYTIKIKDQQAFLKNFISANLKFFEIDDCISIKMLQMYLNDYYLQSYKLTFKNLVNYTFSNPNNITINDVYSYILSLENMTPENVASIDVQKTFKKFPGVLYTVSYSKTGTGIIQLLNETSAGILNFLTNRKLLVSIINEIIFGLIKPIKPSTTGLLTDAQYKYPILYFLGIATDSSLINNSILLKDFGCKHYDVGTYCYNGFVILIKSSLYGITLGLNSITNKTTIDLLIDTITKTIYLSDFSLTLDVYLKIYIGIKYASFSYTFLQSSLPSQFFNDTIFIQYIFNYIKTITIAEYIDILTDLIYTKDSPGYKCALIYSYEVKKSYLALYIKKAQDAVDNLNNNKYNGILEYINLLTLNFASIKLQQDLLILQTEITSFNINKTIIAPVLVNDKTSWQNIIYSYITFCETNSLSISDIGINLVSLGTNFKDVYSSLITIEPKYESFYNDVLCYYIESSAIVTNFLQILAYPGFLYNNI